VLYFRFGLIRIVGRVRNSFLSDLAMSHIHFRQGRFEALRAIHKDSAEFENEESSFAVYTFQQRFDAFTLSLSGSLQSLGKVRISFFIVLMV